MNLDNISDLEGILSRYGGDISRATLANRVIKLAHQLQPLISLPWIKHSALIYKEIFLDYGC